MSIKNTQDTAEKPTTLREKLRKNKHYFQIRFASVFIISTLVSVLLLLIVLLWSAVGGAKKEAYKQLSVEMDAQSTALTRYITQCRNQLGFLADDEKISEACISFKEAFQSIAAHNSYNTDIGSVDEVKAKVKEYYVAEIFPDLKSDIKHFDQVMVPDDLNTLYLQYLYIVANKHDAGEKYLLNSFADGSLYSRHHKKYHPYFRKVMQDYGVDDVLLTDQSGRIIYSVSKRTDLGIDLTSDLYSGTSAAKAYKLAKSSFAKATSHITDFAFYLPDEGRPALFMSIPLMDGKDITGTLLFKVNPRSIDRIISHKDGDPRLSETTLHTMIIGKDRLMRSNDHRLITDPDNYMYELKDENIQNAGLIEEYKTSVLLFEVDKDLAGNSFSLIPKKEKYRDKMGIKQLVVHKKLDINGLDWAMITAIAESEAIGSWIKPALIILVVLFILFNAAMTGYRFSGFLAKRLNLVRHSLDLLSKGESCDDLQNGSEDDLGKIIGSVNYLKERILSITEFSEKIGVGDFTAEFEPYGENDQLGIALTKMKSSLHEAQKQEQQRKEEDKIRVWSTEGIAAFNDLLRQQTENIDQLTYDVLKSLINKLDATLGGFFVLKEEEDEDPYLELNASWAYDRQKYMEKKILPGEGLIGNCYLEKQTTYIKKIPDDYIELSSGFGKGKPNALLIVPMKQEDKVLGVIELASLHEFTGYQIEFVEQVAEMTASTLNIVRLNHQTRELLEVSKQRNEELAAQEEEMRQNMEELTATQEEMRRIKQEEEEKDRKQKEKEAKIMQQLKEQNERLKHNEEMLKKQTAELKLKEVELEEKVEEMEKAYKQLNDEKALMDALMNNVPELIYFKDRKSRFLRATKSMLRFFNLDKQEELVGKTDFDFFSDEHARPAYEDEQNIIKTNTPIIDVVEKETHKDGSITYSNTTKMPLKDKEGNIIGTFGISKDITATEKLKEEARMNNERVEDMIARIKKLEGENKKLSKENSRLKKKEK